MNLDGITSGARIGVEDGTLRDGNLKWSRMRGTRIHITTHRVHPRVKDIDIHIAGTGTFPASSWNQELQALVYFGRYVRLNGIDGPWREVRNPESPNDSREKLALPIKSTGPAQRLP